MNIFDIHQDDLVKLDIFSAQKNEYYISHVCTPMTYEDCLQRVESEDYGKFAGSLARIFEADHRIIGQVSNLDFLSRATIYTAKNYIQWVSMLSTDDNIAEVLVYIFSEIDNNDEEYEHSVKEKQRIDNYIDTIIDAFRDLSTIFNNPHFRIIESGMNVSMTEATIIATEYTNWLAKRLWKPTKEYSYAIPMIVKALFNRVYGKIYPIGSTHKECKIKESAPHNVWVVKSETTDGDRVFTQIYGGYPSKGLAESEVVNMIRVEYSDVEGDVDLDDVRFDKVRKFIHVKWSDIRDIFATEIKSGKCYGLMNEVYEIVGVTV